MALNFWQPTDISRLGNLLQQTMSSLENMSNSWEICQGCAKILLADEHKMQLAYYLQSTDWFQRCSEFGFFDEPFLILSTIFY